MAEKASDNHTSSRQPAEPPVQTDSNVTPRAPVAAEAADSAQLTGVVVQTLAIRQLMRIVADLPPHQFMPLSDALAQAKSCLGSSDLALRKLRQDARRRRLTIAAWRILPDGTEQVLLFRAAFFQYFAILSPDSIRPIASVRGPVSLVGGRWYYFVGRRRFERLYSTAAPSKPAAQAPAPSTSLTPRNPRGAGAKRDFDREFILIEAAAYVMTNNLPPSLEELVQALQLTLKDKMPKDTQGKKILGPFFRRMKQALGH